MDAFKKRVILYIICLCFVILCLVLMIFCSGFSYEPRKFRALLLTIVWVLLFQFLFGDIIKFMFYAVFFVFRKKLGIHHGPDLGRIVAGAEIYESDALLQLQLARYRAQLSLTAAHYNESLNLKYKVIANELFLFGRYFLLLLLLVVGSRDCLLYYNTTTLHTVFGENRLTTTGLNSLHTLKDVDQFLELIIVKAFNEGFDYDGKKIEEPGWIQLRIAKLLGVVRLRQVRLREKFIGLSTPKYAEMNHNPRWVLPYRQLHYIDKYWRTYGPWLDGQTDTSWLTPSRHYGRINDYHEDLGYVALLSRDVPNSLKVLQYIRNGSWLNDKTAALFVDFTLYNVDSNVFSVCTLMLEYTPFGNVLSTVDVRSAELLMNFDNMPALTLFIALLYMLQLIQFAKMILLNLWHRTKASRSAWNYVDMVIVVLNVIVFIMVLSRELKVAALMQRFQISNKLEFVDFRVAAQLDYLASVFIGLLICVVTLRLWKILQFAKPFRLFTRTLYNGLVALVTLILVILIFLYAFGICSYIVNGNDTERFVRLVRSFTSSMSYSFGFSRTVSPSDLTHGGLALGFILYALLMLVIAILLLNLFITLICDHFNQSKDTPDDDEAKDLSFGAFLKAEYAYLGQFFLRYCSCCQRRAYNPKKGTIKQQIDKAVGKMEKDVEQRRLAGRESAGPRYGHNLRNVEQVRLMARILNTQVAIMRYHQQRRKRGW